MVEKVNRHSFASGHFSFICLFLLLITISSLQAKPVDSQKAQRFVKGWMNQNRKPLDTALSGKIGSVDTYTDPDGQIQYYVINLKPEGYVIVSADDLLEPVIAFSGEGSFIASANNPLFVLVEKDTKARNHFAKRQQQKRAGKSERTQKQKKWDQVSAKADLAYGMSYAMSSVTDVWVAPLIQSEWGQTHDGTGNLCYNYYTPSEYPSGCVATAMAQLMRYHQYPTTGVGGQSGTIGIDPEDDGTYYTQNATTRGGTAAGGAYNWSLMPAYPVGATTAQRSEIGSLCYDAGVAVEMYYAPSGSGAYSSDVPDALMNYFNYSNAVHYYEYSGIPTHELKTMINTNLDAGLPVYLGITGDVGGHAILVDGYGYEDPWILYHHLNMGWYGSDDAWYMLPDINSDPSFDVVNHCVYNIYPTGTGEIISGRISDSSWLPVAGVNVQAKQGDSVISQDVTDSKGVYALKNLSSNQVYEIWATKTGCSFASNGRTVDTGSSSSGSNTLGVRWSVDFTADVESPPVASDATIDISDPNAVLIGLVAEDEGLPDPPAKLTFTITSLPQHGWLYDPNDGSEITSVPYTLQNDGNSVTYNPCDYYFEGSDSFTFIANDGGIAPDGGDSNEATVTFNINTIGQTVYEQDLNKWDYFPFMANYKKSRCQMIYLASEIQGPARLLTALSLNAHTSPSIGFSNWTIRMQHTTLDAYTSKLYTNDGWTTVYQGDISAPSVGWNKYPFQNAFEYDGVSNLLIDLSYDNATTGTYGQTHDSITAQKRTLTTFTSSGDPLALTTAQYDHWKRILNIQLDSQPDVSMLLSDFDVNCQVGTEDLTTMIDAWLTESGDAEFNSDCDISETADQKVDLADFAVFASEWLEIGQ